MNNVTIKGKTFKPSITEEEILKSVKKVAERINRDMAGKNPLFLAVLNGSFIFAADLMREITIPCQVSFVKLASYEGTTSTGKVTEVIGINDKFLFVNELFGGSMEKYNKSIENLNDLKTLNGAMIYLNELKIELQWNSSNEAYQKLKDLVSRKFES